MNVGLARGFGDPVRDSQAVFRAVLNAMARPGHVQSVSGPEDVPRPLDRATAAVLLTLVDGETSLWLDEQAADARGWAAFHCGVRPAEIAEARFVVAIDPPPLGRLCPGTEEEPEASATLILQVPALDDGVPLRLTGPGLAAPTMLAIGGLNEQFFAEWTSNHALFPKGIDVILCSGDLVAALPRTVRLERA